MEEYFDPRRITDVEVLSVPNIYDQDCWVVGLKRLTVDQKGEEHHFFGIRTEWSDKSITYFRRRNSDVLSLLKKLRKSLPKSGKKTARTLMFEASFSKIKESEENNVLVEKLLKNIISMSPEYSQSDAVLTFFEVSTFDQTMKPTHEFHSYQSPVTVTDIRRSNGFCLASTETILCDAHSSKEVAGVPAERSLKWRSNVLTCTQTRCEDGITGNKESALLNFAAAGLREPRHAAIKPQSSVSNQPRLQLAMLETDILE